MQTPIRGRLRILLHSGPALALELPEKFQTHQYPAERIRHFDHVVLNNLEVDALHALKMRPSGTVNRRGEHAQTIVRNGDYPETQERLL